LYIDGLNAAKAQSAHVSQHANMFPLALHIVPDANRDAVKAKVKELKMSVGMVTVMWLVRALGEADEGAHLIDLFTNPEWYGWAQTLARGGTATWETWTSDTDGQSESHAWGAAGLVGHVNYILGITPTKPQFEQVRIKPLDFGTRLTWAKGAIPTDRGDLSVDWSRNDQRYSLTVSLPVNVTADLYVPKGTQATTSLTVDGAQANGEVEGNYLVIRGVGSGTHTVVRPLGS
jgi:alpha-L-rhamnosidase